MHRLVHRPAKQNETVVPVPGLSMIVAQHGFDSVVDSAVEFTHSRRIRQQDASVLQRDQIAVDLAVLEMRLAVRPGLAFIDRTSCRDPPPVVAE